MKRTLLTILALSLCAAGGCSTVTPGPWSPEAMSRAEDEVLLPTVRWQELDGRCWFVRITKTGSGARAWALQAKARRRDGSDMSTYVEADSFDAAVAETLRRMEKGQVP